MKHKYIQDLGIKEEDTPFGYCKDENSIRERKWSRERYVYGFDSRETWSLDVALIMLIYERLMMYNDKTDNIINKEFYKFEFNGKMYTFQEMIDMCIDKCKTYITCSIHDEFTKEIIDSTNEIFDILKLIYRHLWW